MVFSFLEIVTVSSHLRRLFFPEGRGVVRRGRAREPGPLSSLYLLISRLSLECRSCKRLYRLRGEKVTLAGDECHCCPELIPPPPLSDAVSRRACNGHAALEMHVDLSPPLSGSGT